MIKSKDQDLGNTRKSLLSVMVQGGNEGCHLISQNFVIEAYCVAEFHALRELCIEGGEEAFLTSLKRSKAWKADGGKSNAHFAKTKDDRYIIKEITRSEKHSFLDFASSYFEHMKLNIETGESSCLAKIFGIFKARKFYDVLSIFRLPVLTHV